jgi:hypothetical protein
MNRSYHNNSWNPEIGTSIRTKPGIPGTRETAISQGKTKNRRRRYEVFSERR